MPKLYQYLINDIIDIKSWLVKNSFDVASFRKVIVESVEKVQVFGNLDEALNEKFIIKIRFFNKSYEFNVVSNKKDKFDLTILTKKNLVYKNQTYNIIESSDNIKNYNRQDGSEFEIKRYICEPILENSSDHSEIISVPELLVFYRIYD